MKDFAYFIGIFVTGLLGVWNLINNYRNSRRTTYINTVTSERVKWIDKLRQNISTFSGLTHSLSYMTEENVTEELKEIDKLRYLIRLQLNPDGEHDQKIESLLTKIPNLVGSTKVMTDELKKALNELTEATQKLLKQEWDKVNSESTKGNIKHEFCPDMFLDWLNKKCLNYWGNKSK